jgi:hypothetical protein
MRCLDDDSKGTWNMNSLNSYCKRWPHELNTILIWISIYNILGPVIAMCASFLKTFAWCKFGPGGLNVPSVTLKPNSYLFCDLWNDIFESLMTLEPDAIAMWILYS